MQTPRNSPVAKPFLNIWKREIFIRFVWFRLWLLEELVITVNKPSQTGFKDRQSSPAGCYMMRASIIQKQTAGVVMFWGGKSGLYLLHGEKRKTLLQPWCNPTTWLRGNKAFVGWGWWRKCIFNEEACERQRWFGKDNAKAGTVIWRLMTWNISWIHVNFRCNTKKLTEIKCQKIENNSAAECKTRAYPSWTCRHTLISKLCMCVCFIMSHR